MLTHELLEDEAILIVKPAEPLAAGDFETLAREIDPYLEKQGELRGLMIE
ncbi:MAG: STAS/SEC14 domain-containing protein, partial [Myxococcales bacterium]